MSLTRKIIVTSKAAKPVAPYNQAIVVDRTVYTSGILGLDPATNKLVGGGTVEEARQALKSLKAILEAAGSSLDNVVKTNILVSNIDDFGSVNEVYKEFFAKDHPARICYQAGKLPLGANIEIEVIAMTGNVTNEYVEDLSAPDEAPMEGRAASGATVRGSAATATETRESTATGVPPAASGAPPEGPAPAPTKGKCPCPP